MIIEKVNKQVIKEIAKKCNDYGNKISGNSSYMLYAMTSQYLSKNLYNLPTPIKKIFDKLQKKMISEVYEYLDTNFASYKLEHTSKSRLEREVVDAIDEIDPITIRDVDIITVLEYVKSYTYDESYESQSEDGSDADSDFSDEDD